MSDEDVGAADADAYLSDYLKPGMDDAPGLVGGAAVGSAAGYATGDPFIGLFATAVGSGAVYLKQRKERYDEGVEAARNSLDHFRGLWTRDEE